ncbi:DNA gyrase/topoisomerase IV subunit A [Myroides sp. DF42-4-2]|uniref:DNA gyrase/topoisomerase IV subunit A n=1 Tax=unclassified Myroides TaxID=2642485 RepID=UPI002575F38C|nr:DNA gyrase/topoisomerase IV subunit A [Myroides sp. DF42-4-2]MDM1407490.1 DNA gyrase/topoisomerase IV subunit A [Myroides sp. DF42-4-2]
MSTEDNLKDDNLKDDIQSNNLDNGEFVEDHTALQEEEEEKETITKVTGMYKEWFLDYASYVILERAVPAIEDGFKPVQRRIMHSMKELDDGRYNKVANIVGHTMQYHPHGDASIGDAMVQLGQKELLIDMQGNWGNILTGDGAAASRYIEARLSKFALEVLYSPKITEWQSSYDGRRNEPINLPVKFPLLLAQGAEGIAVGLSTKVLPHNFNELIDASVKILKGKPFTLYPDFPTEGIADVSAYNDGLRGGRVRVRARISQLDKNTLVVTQIPFSTTTTSLIDSILKANEKGKLKIRKIEDNTAASVEILIHLPPGTSPDKTIDALYAFTACETSIAPLACIIQDNKPLFIGVSEMLKRSTHQTVDLLRQELEIELQELEERWHFLSLERIFIENRIYRAIEEEETWEGVLSAIDEGLKPFIVNLKRAVTQEDIIKLTEIRIKRISRFDIDKANQLIEALEGDIEKVKYNLEHLVDFAIKYFTSLKEKYGKGKERKTELRSFDTIEATKVVLRNTKLYVNRQEGFFGTSLRKDEYVCDCSDIDDIIVFLRDGSMVISKVEEKRFVGKDIIHIDVFAKNDKRTIYNLIYRDGKSGPSYSKRFNVMSITRDKVYDLTQGNPGSQVLYFSANPNGEAEVVTILLRQLSNVKKLKFDLDFADLLIKGRIAKGNLVTKYAIKKIELKEKGISTLRPRKIWYDEAVRRLNVEGRGELLGEFKAEDRLMIITQSGKIKTVVPELTTHFEEDMIVLEKWKPNKPISAIYFDGEKARYYVKRFIIENENREDIFISEHENSKLELISTDYRPVVEVVFAKVKGVQKENLVVDLEQFITIKGIKALGNQLTADKVKQIDHLESLPYEEEVETQEDTTNYDLENLPDVNVDEDGQSSLF